MQNSLKFKQITAFVIAAVLVCGIFSFFVVSKNGAVMAADETVIELTIDNAEMTVNGQPQAIDENGTVPLITEGRTLVPIRAIIEAVGGDVSWDGESRETTLTYNDNIIVLTIDSTTAYLNGSEKTLDAAPAIIGGRTMLPVRFIAEGFGFDVDWNDEEKTITITVGDSASVEITNNTEDDDVVTENTDEAVTEGTGETVTTEAGGTITTDENASVVYFTSDISPEGIMAVYNKLGFEPEGNVAIKLSTGEPPASNYLDPDLIKDLVQSVNGTIVECNTAYGGSRASTAMHKQVAEDHGFTAIADVDIMDEDGSMEIPVEGGDNISVDYVGTHLANYDSMITLSHFKGHAMGGFGGAIKNMSIGVASSEGKCYIHTAGASTTTFAGGTQDNFLESMAEATKGVVDYFDGKIVYVSVMNNLSIDCDCNGHPAEPEMNDVGILASADPVALDQACVDIVYAADRSESGSLIDRIESRNGLHTLEQAEKIGLGSRTYNLVDINE